MRSNDERVDQRWVGCRDSGASLLAAKSGAKSGPAHVYRDIDNIPTYLQCRLSASLMPRPRPAERYRQTRLRRGP